jgi:hypothetical protein
VKTTLRALVYLDEQTGTFRDTIFQTNGFEAVASTISADGRYLVFVGASEKNPDEKLYVLDLDKDRYELLGEPPAPPPLDAAEPHDSEAVSMAWAWEAPDRWYTELEPSIMRFTGPHILAVSYGKDSFKGRSKTRTWKKWDLDAMKF